ncbi:MAG: stage 0 sporulation protein [Clostridia bacterium]|nr:stage 0 sporulation protein [Clostridia bacterium]
MIEVIGVRIKPDSKTLFYRTDGVTFRRGQFVVVDTQRGVECGFVYSPNHEMHEELFASAPPGPIKYMASPKDIDRYYKLLDAEKTAGEIFKKRVVAYALDMKLVGVDYLFDGSKILFYYTAPSRVDFRALVRELAGVFRSRIELRQIGVRDETRLLGGLGVCGRPFCCKQFLNSFQPVTIKMTKEQGLSLNNSKISGACGRLMCCLKYEQETYEQLLKNSPKVGALVNTPEGKGEVTSVNLLTGKLTVKLEKNPDSPPQIFDKADVKLLKDAKITVSREELEQMKELEDSEETS